MSLSSAIDAKNANPDLIGRFYPDLIPWAVDPHANMTLGTVLQNGNSAYIPNTTTPQDATDFNILGCVKIETGTVGMGNQPALVIGEPGDILQIKGATALGSILVGNGVNTETLPVGANGLVLKANSGAPLGVEWGTDASGGTVMAVNAGTNISVGGTIAQPIVNLASPLTSTLGMGSVALTDKNGASGTAGQLLSAGTGGETEWVNPPVTIGGVSSGTNIFVDNTNPFTPIVNFATPTTADILIGTTQQIIAKDNYATPIYTMSIDATGLNDTYLSGGVENKEDISVTATSVQDTISTTNTTDYINSSVLTCDTNFVNDVMTSQVLTSGLQKTASTSMTCNTSSTNPLAQISCGVSVPTSSPFPDITASVSMGCSDTTNGFLNISQSEPFQPSYSTTLDKNGLVQNNSSGTGFNLQSAQNIALTVPSANVINITNGNNIEFLDPTATGYTTTISKQGVDTNYFVAGSVSSNADLTNNAGNAELLLSASNLATPNAHLLRLEVPQSGNALIEHTTTGTPLRNLTLSTQGQLTATAGSAGFSISGAGASMVGNAGGQLLLTAGATGGEIFTTSATSSFTSPLYVFENTNASNASYPVMRFSRPIPASTAGDTIGGISYWADDASGVYREWGRIAGFAQNVATGNQDGRIGIWTTINGATPVEVFNFNGADNENNSFRPLDVNGNVLKTSSGNLTIDATASSGVGNVVISPKVTTGISTLRMTNSSAPGDDLVVEKNANFVDFYQTGGALLNSNAQMRLGNGGLRMITSSATPPTFGLDNASFATATHQFTGTNYDISLPSTGSFSYTNASTINVKGASVSTSTGDLSITGTLSSGTGTIELKPKDAVAGSGTGLILTGNTLLNASAGGNSGQHLCLTINGSVYKIALLNP